MAHRPTIEHQVVENFVIFMRENDVIPNCCTHDPGMVMLEYSNYFSYYLFLVLILTISRYPFGFLSIKGLKSYGVYIVGPVRVIGFYKL